MSDLEIKDGNEEDLFRKKLALSMLLPGVFVFLMWMVNTTGILFKADMTRLGIFPLTYRGLVGILLAPLVHQGYGHLINNSLPVFFLGTFLFYFYSEIAIKVILWIYFLTGTAVWIIGRASWHIGASGLVYGLASFLFFSGIIRKHYRLAGLSLLIVFLYGSMVWGIFPDVYRDVSWESHLTGFIAGIGLAVAFRKQGPRAPEYDWQTDDMPDEDDPAQE